MESLGRKLREAREKHSYNLEQIARDTNISKAYLEALEEENFGVIPGDTYVLGFLRNYGEYLGLNPEELVGLYRNLRIQEQPMPMSELLQGRPRGSRPRPRLLAVLLAVLVVAGVGVFLLVRYGLPRREEGAARPAQQASAAAEGEYVLSEEAITRWYSQGETVSVPIDGQQYRMSFAEVGDRLTLKIPGGTVELTIGQTRQVDLDGDQFADIRLQLNDLDVTGSNRRANVSIYRLPKAAEGLVAQAGEAAAQPGTGAQGAQGAAAAGGTAMAGTTPTSGTGSGAAGTTGAASVATPASPSPTPAPAGEEPTGSPLAAGATFSGPLELQAAGSPAPFRLSISFRGYVLLRYLADGETRDERFFHKGETFALDVKREARLWISNAGALRLSVAGKDVELGRAGEVVTRTIRWSETPDTAGYHLQVLPSD